MLIGTEFSRTRPRRRYRTTPIPDGLSLNGEVVDLRMILDGRKFIVEHEQSTTLTSELAQTKGPLNEKRTFL